MFAEGKQLSPQHINQHLLAFNLSSEGAESAGIPDRRELGDRKSPRDSCGRLTCWRPEDVPTGGSSVFARITLAKASSPVSPKWLIEELQLLPVCVRVCMMLPVMDVYQLVYRLLCGCCSDVTAQISALIQ